MAATNWLQGNGYVWAWTCSKKLGICLYFVNIFRYDPILLIYSFGLTQMSSVHLLSITFCSQKSNHSPEQYKLSFSFATLSVIYRTGKTL